jgi:hypothetical protein
MKNRFKLFTATLALLVITAFGLQAQPFGPFTGSVNATVTNTAAGVFTATTVASNAIALYRGRGIAFWPAGSAANDGTGATNFIVTCNLCYDPTLTAPVVWSDTTYSFTFATPTATPSTPFMLYTNIPAATLDNAAWIRIKTVSWQTTNKLTLTNYWSIFP